MMNNGGYAVFGFRTVKVLKKTLRQSFSTCTILLSEHKVEPLLECQSFLVKILPYLILYHQISFFNHYSHFYWWQKEQT